MFTYLVKFNKKRKKIVEKSLWRHYDVIFADFCIEIEEFRLFHFYGGLSEKKYEKITSP